MGDWKAYAELSVDAVGILWRVWLHRSKRTDDLVMKCIFLVSRWPEAVVDSVAEYSVITELQFIVLLAAFAVGWRMLDERCSNKWMVWMGIAESKGVLKKLAIVFVIRLYHLRHNQPCLCFIYYSYLYICTTT